MAFSSPQPSFSSVETFTGTEGFGLITETAGLDTGSGVAGLDAGFGVGLNEDENEDAFCGVKL